MSDPRFPAGALLAAMLLAVAAPAGGAQDVPPAVLAPVPAAASPSALPEGWQHGAFAEIYVRGYADSNGDGIGDLRGLTGKLDYLKQLGVSGIWLMPITRSTDHDHGYAVEDYRDIEREFGTLADFDELLKQAHARGIGVIVDYVINHSGNTHPFFLAAAADRHSDYRSWYLWQDTAPKGWEIFKKDPWNATPTGAYFSQFSAHMPDWNLKNPKVMAWHLDNLRFWLNRGVDGFRFDAVAHLVENGKDATRDQPESLALMREAVRVVHSYPNRYVVCEATREEGRWASDEGCGGAFAIWTAPNFAKAAKGDATAVEALSSQYRDANPGMATMASNHDLFAGERLWDQVGGDMAAYKLAAAAYLLGPGTPFIYYGEEIGMSAAPSLQGDPRLRIPMSWSAQGFSAAKPFRPLAGNVAEQNLDAENGREGSLLAWYRQLLALRNSVPALARGRARFAGSAGKNPLEWGFHRELDGQTAIVHINFGDTDGTWDEYFGSGLDCRVALASSRINVQPRFTTDGLGYVPSTLPPHSVTVFVCDQPR